MRMLRDNLCVCRAATINETKALAILYRPRNHAAAAGARNLILIDARLSSRSSRYTNGLPLSKIHHAAFDADLIGIDPDYRVHVSGHLLEQRDGPMLEALKQLQGSVLHLPKRVGDRPDRDRLAVRFERFKAAA